MAAQLIREWSGIQQFPPATQTKLLELLGKLKQEVQFSPPPLELTLFTFWPFYCCFEMTQNVVKERLYFFVWVVCVFARQQNAKNGRRIERTRILIVLLRNRLLEKTQNVLCLESGEKRRCVLGSLTVNSHVLIHVRSLT